ncbi:two-component system activity regulator YycH [Marinisporobacter balticus]|uniref:Regulatory protein YycH of two-component signal transduction system YycFG n=1 Tax=Marinisporobacter balticus TaxID=2018667 RepID=A0A4R2LFA3_9FIRM|nr:two-component system activity regulator YycH [Marinisporobacter balticus]TCO77935.1 regulatory protein YycH of two-component signal transduction system YycFG [Marinisporobacter balticus]
MKKFSKEQFKTWLLVSLFILSIALNQQLWERISLKKVMPDIRQIETLEVESNIDIKDTIVDILNPQSFRINFGGGLHTVFYSDNYGLWQETLKIFKNEYFKKKVLIERIDKDAWMKARDFRSIEMKFGYTMPVEILREAIEGKTEGIYGKIQGFDRILVSLTGDNSVYMADGEENFYLVQGIDMKNKFSKIIMDIEKNGYDAYYAFKDLYGIDNEGLMPIERKDNIEEMQVIEEIDPMDEVQVEDFAGDFFGENLDFIRKIRETSGAVTYLYGYGQKALKINDVGVLHYVEDIDNQKASKNIKVEDAMKVALLFVSEHGGWANTDAYLKSIKPIEKNNQKGYKFFFGYRLNGVPVYCSSEAEQKIIDTPIEVDLLGEQVISYKRLLKKEEIGIKFLERKEDAMTLSARQVIDMNFELIKNDFSSNIKENKKINKQEILEKVLGRMKEIDIGYYDNPVQEPNKLISMWIIKTDQVIYYFDAHNGRILSRSKM